MSNNFKNRAESHELRDEEIMYEIRVNTKKTGYTPSKKNKVHSDELKAEEFGCVDLGDPRHELMPGVSDEDLVLFRTGGVNPKDFLGDNWEEDIDECLWEVQAMMVLAHIALVVFALGTVAVLITGFYWLLRVLIFMI